MQTHTKTFAAEELRAIIVIELRSDGLYHPYYRTALQPHLWRAASASGFEFFEDANDYTDTFHTGCLVFGRAVIVGHESLDGIGLNEGLTEISQHQMGLSFDDLWNEITA